MFDDLSPTYSVYEKSFPVFTLCGIIVSREQIRKLEFVPKAANIVGLQFADLIAYPIACHIMWPERPKPAFDIIKGNIYVSDGKELGIKVIK